MAINKDNLRSKVEPSGMPYYPPDKKIIVISKYFNTSNKGLIKRYPIGKISFNNLIVSTRPSISYIVIKLARYTKNLVLSAKESLPRGYLLDIEEVALRDIALSTTESTFLKGPIRIYANNNRAIVLVLNLEFYCFYRLRDKVTAGTINFIKIPTIKIVANELV
ncbi:hypothetical protein N7491_006109 [Penicillium cf. griseofulvum]|uniref:Uncharacterized protein n=1 Tax=Penicillium cf. griseofulvum TaxID=2972120 RepID=A0A9W9IWG4_9EURO|nr:hypothetical protein N7472_010860 [Penicillium cf. griseofulvum]KAJ5429093.1 hypothetical protein N7491_006109 [Penicillium cf. griseofulvum]